MLQFICSNKAKIVVGDIMKDVKVEKCQYSGQKGESCEVAVTTSGLREQAFFDIVSRICDGEIRSFCKDSKKLYDQKESK